MTLPRLVGILIVLSLAGSVECIKGVDPSIEHLYKPIDGKFKCINSDVSIPYSAVNDNYCDCPDGTDEPGTSACSSFHYKPQFYCHNKGYFPDKIHLSKVNDGICEEECCDGTDEPAGVCPDTCTQRGKQYQVELEHSERVRDKALIIKRKYIESAKKELERLSIVQGDKTMAVIKAGEKEHAAKGEVDRLEALSKDALSAKLASPLYKHLLDARNVLDNLKKENEALEADVSLLLDILESLKNSYNPNYQDMGVLGAVRDYDAYISTRKERSASNDLLSKLQNEDLVNLIVSLDQNSGDKKDDIDSMLFNIEAYLPPTMVDNYRTFKKAFVGWLVKFSIIPEPSMQEDASCGFRKRILVTAY